MTTVLCTLYNSLYLDKGLVLYDSLCECAKDFKLYVLCMDDKCYEVLTDLKQEHHIPVRLSDFEEGDMELLKAKSNRPIGEYCWTCSSSFINFVLQKYNEPICTYIDADMYFYHDPKILVDEMLSAGKSVMIVPHWFSKEYEHLAAKVGLYCVEFNTFLNNEQGCMALNYWRNRCLECCSNLGDGIHWGDQKYLEEIVEKFDCVHVCTYQGAGVALWNISSFDYDGKNLIKKDSGDKNELFFFHFQNVIYIFPKYVIYGKKSKESDITSSKFNELYVRYFKKLDQKKNFLFERYKINVLIAEHPSSSKTIRTIMKSSFMGKCYRLIKAVISQDVNLIHI